MKTKNKTSKWLKDLINLEPKNGVFAVSGKWAKKLKRKKEVKKPK